MRLGRLVVVGLMLGAGAVTAAEPAEGERVRLWRKYPSQVTVQDGPAPGLVVMTSQLSTFSSSTLNLNGNVGAHMGQCTTLVYESALSRDLKKEPLRKDEILGFSCTTAE